MDLHILPVNHLRKTKKEYKSLQENRRLMKYYQNNLDKACFQHDMAYGYLKDLSRRTFADKVLRYKAFNIAKDRNYNEC